MRPRREHRPLLATTTGAGASPLSGYGSQHQHPHTNPVLSGWLGAHPAIGMLGFGGLQLSAPGWAVQWVREKRRFPHQPPTALAGLGWDWRGGEQGGTDGRSRDFTDPINQVRNQPCKTHSTDGSGVGNPPLSSQWELGCKEVLAGTETGKWQPLLRGQG